MEFEKLYTAEDVAQITGLTLRTIRNYIKTGKLTGRRIGVQWRFTAADIQALFDEPAQTEGGKEERTTGEEEIAVTAQEGIWEAPAGGPMEEEKENPPQKTVVLEEEADGSSLPERVAREFLERKKAGRASSCCIVDMPGMTEQEANFLYSRIQTLAAVYQDTPKRLDVAFSYDENREQARFAFSGALDAACAVMNLCDVQ